MTERSLVKLSVALLLTLFTYTAILPAPSDAANASSHSKVHKGKRHKGHKHHAS